MIPKQAHKLRPQKMGQGFGKKAGVVFAKITTYPTSQVVFAEGDPVTFISVGTDHTGIQWQVYNGITWVSAGGTDTEANYTIADTTGLIGSLYRVLYKGDALTATSNTVTISL